jgi:hypothetical protein
MGWEYRDGYNSDERRFARVLRVLRMLRIRAYGVEDQTGSARVFHP